ncbi:hypothetical protein ACTID9_11425 [Brevibacillus fluminis]|uniref:hypothetical protein n=1 Tax=Brevibacillus fluminis TaxID=511487 RepID=UPI003F8CEA31
MDKDLFRKTLEISSNEDLFQFAKLLNLRVPGFRTVTLDTMRLQRPKLLQALLAPRNFVTYMEKVKEHAEGNSTYQEYTAEQLTAQIRNRSDYLLRVIAVLIASNDHSLLQKAHDIFNEIEKSPSERGNEEPSTLAVTESSKNINEELQQLNLLLSQERKKLKLAQDKNDEYKQKLKELQKELEDTKSKARLDKKESDKRCRDLESALKQSEQNKEKVMDELNRAQQLLKENAAEISRLHALCMTIKEKPTASHPNHDALETRQKEAASLSNEAPQKTKVLMIGNPQNTSIRNWTRFDVVIIENRDIETKLNEESLQGIDQVWLLSYKVPARQQSFVQNVVPKEQLHTFSNFIEIQKYVN